MGGEEDVFAGWTSRAPSVSRSMTPLALHSVAVARKWLEEVELKTGREVISVKGRIERFGHHGTAMYAGCPTCTKSIHSSQPCGHRYTRARNFYRLKIFLTDETLEELEATAWEATRYFTGMSAEDFEPIQLRGEHTEILKRCIGWQWILQISRVQTNRDRGPYAKVERAEPVSKKELFPLEKELVEKEESELEVKASTPDRQLAAFGEGSPMHSSMDRSRVSAGGSVVEESRKVIREGNVEFVWGLCIATLLSAVLESHARVASMWVRLPLWLTGLGLTCRFGNRRMAAIWRSESDVKIRSAVGKRGNRADVSGRPSVMQYAKGIVMSSEACGANMQSTERTARRMLSWLEKEVVDLRAEVLKLRDENERLKYAAWRWKARGNVATKKLAKKKDEYEELLVRYDEEHLARKADQRQIDRLVIINHDLERKLIQACVKNGPPSSIPGS
ncbi:hypothetical protein R1sor_004130 [Riccia sorocarpa]|uniref:Uncharacterized protein n=1 Tax=Riccia sorocarpa TaxID=122646 RepID=A0ABD3H4B0_9MARC